MGWLGDQINNIKNSAQDTYDNVSGKNGKNAQLGTLGGAFIGTLGGGALAGASIGSDLANPPTPPTAPGMDPTLESIKQQQMADAKQFRTDLPQTQNNMYEQAYKGERRNLASNIQATRNNANSRGFLYSGLEQGNELEQRANSNANLAQTRAEINNSTESQARQLEANAVQSGVQQQQAIGAIQDQVMSQALANMTARRQVISGIGQGVGAGVGTYAANTNNYGMNRPTTYGT